MTLGDMDAVTTRKLGNRKTTLLSLFDVDTKEIV